MDNIKDFLLNDNFSSISSITGDIVIWILSLIFLWKIFEKAGEKGWKAIIPVYSFYILFKIAWKTSYFWLILAFLIAIICGSVIAGLNPESTVQGGIGSTIVIGSAVGFIIIYINLLSNICYSFNKSRLFMIGLLFLNIIFMGILAFDKSEYIGSKVNK